MSVEIHGGSWLTQKISVVTLVANQVERLKSYPLRSKIAFQAHGIRRCAKRPRKIERHGSDIRGRIYRHHHQRPAHDGNNAGIAIVNRLCPHTKPKRDMNGVVISPGSVNTSKAARLCWTVKTLSIDADMRRLL